MKTILALFQLLCWKVLEKVFIVVSVSWRRQIASLAADPCGLSPAARLMDGQAMMPLADVLISAKLNRQKIICAT